MKHLSAFQTSSTSLYKLQSYSYLYHLRAKFIFEIFKSRTKLSSDDLLILFLVQYPFVGFTLSKHWEQHTKSPLILPRSANDRASNANWIEQRNNHRELCNQVSPKLPFHRIKRTRTVFNTTPVKTHNLGRSIRIAVDFLAAGLFPFSFVPLRFRPAYRFFPLSTTIRHPTCLILIHDAHPLSTLCRGKCNRAQENLANSAILSRGCSSSCVCLLCTVDTF